MSLVRQLYYGMGALVVLTICISGFAVFETKTLATSFVEYRTTAKSSLVANELSEDLFEARMAAQKFRLNGDFSLTEEVQGNIAEVYESAELLSDYINTYPEGDALIPVPAMLERYEALLLEAVELRRKRNELVSKVAANGTDIRKKLSEIMESAFTDGDPQASFVAGTAMAELLLGRLYLERFLVDNSDASFERAQSELKAAQDRLQVLEGELQNPRRRELATQAEAGLAEFASDAFEIQQTINSRNARYQEMDQIGPDALSRSATVLDAVIAKQDTIGPMVAAQMRTAITVVIIVASLGAIIGIGMAIWTGKSASGKLNNITHVMTELSDGNLDSEIVHIDADHELARMNNAMVVFLENAKKSRKLEEEVKLAEEREREQREKNEARKSEEEKSKQAAAERERALEREKLETLQVFQADMDRVLSRAAAGDFEGKMSKDVDDPSLRELANVVNKVLLEMDKNISDVVEKIGGLANGDITVRIDGDREGAFLKMKNDFNAAMEAVSSSIGQVSMAVESVAGTAAELESASSSMARMAEHNAAAVEETSATVEEMSQSVKQVVDNASVANEATQKIQSRAGITQQIAEKTGASMEEMQVASSEIGRVVKVIEDIAFQINLLALNAGVEAARAGEAGRGFTVVASEVRSLAQRSQESVQEIKGVIDASTKSVNESVENVQQSQEAVLKILSDVDVVAKQIDEITGAVKEQATGINEVNRSLQSIDNNAQKTAAAIEEVSASNASLNSDAHSLTDAIGSFKGAESRTDRTSVEAA